MTSRAIRQPEQASRPAGRNPHVSRALWTVVRCVERIIEWLIVAALALLVLVVNTEVLARFVLDRSLTWNLEVSRILFIWIVFLGAALAIRRSAYSSIEIFSHRLPDWWKTRVVPATVFGFGIVFAGLGLARTDFRVRHRAVTNQ